MTLVYFIECDASKRRRKAKRDGLFVNPASVEAVLERTDYTTILVGGKYHHVEGDAAWVVESLTRHLPPGEGS